mgnify:FL=1
MLPEGFVLASEYDGSAQTTSVTPVVGQAQTRRDDDDETDAEKLKRLKDSDRVDLASSLYKDFTTAVNPFSFSAVTGKLEPGTRTATGYIIGDNGEYLDPLTGGLAFFGSDARKYALNPEDAPDLDLSKEGGINEKFYNVYTSMFDKEREKAQREASRELAKDRAEYLRKRSFKKTRPDRLIGLGEKELDKARAEQRKKDKAETTKKKKSDTAKLRAATKRESKRKSVAEQRATQRATQAAQRAVASIMKDKEREYNTGGLASKSKPKPKKIRQGGLASR